MGPWVRQKLTGRLGDCVRPHWKMQKHEDLNIAQKRARFIHKMLRKTHQIPRQKGNILEFSEVARSRRVLIKNSTTISRETLFATAGNLKVNEQSKYKSVPIFFIFLAMEVKPELFNFWACDINRKTHLRCEKSIFWKPSSCLIDLCNFHFEK